MNDLYFVQLFKKNVLTYYIIDSHNVDIALGCSFRVIGPLFWKIKEFGNQFTGLYIYIFRISVVYMCQWYIFQLYICVRGIDFYCIYVLGV